MNDAAATLLPDDLDALKQLFLAREQAWADGEKKLVERDKKLEERDKKIAILEEFIRFLKARQFGKSSERFASEAQASLFNEAEQLAQEVPAHEPAAEPSSGEHSPTQRPRGRKPLPEHLYRHKVVHELAPDRSQCPCGCALEAFDEVVSEQLGIIPAELYVIQHCRRKYRCPNCPDKAPVTAPLPAQPFPKSNASPELMAHVAVSKFLDGLPFYRQEQIWRRVDIELPRATLANWTIACGELVQPLVNLFHEQQCLAEVLHIDETPVQVLKEPDKPPESNKYFWVTVSGPPLKPIYLFHYHPSRGSDVARTLLEGFQGAVLSDDWAVYAKVCEELALTHIACNDHARRKFDEALKAEPKKKAATGTSKAAMALNFYQKLYAIERRIKEAPLDEKHRVRQAESVPVWDRFIAWMESHLNRVTPESKLGKALHYTYRLRDKLRHYCTDGYLPISNQLAENAIRPFAIARKNFLFYDTPQGAKSSANLYSLIMTAKSHGLDPFYYLAHAFKHLPLAETLEDIERLLPWHLDNATIKAGFGVINRGG